MKLFDKQFFKKPAFYASVVAFVLALIFVIAYSKNGGTQYNDETITSSIVVVGIIGLVALGASCIVNIRYL